MPAMLSRPMFFENWVESLNHNGKEQFEGYECLLYSDAWITGEEEIGPYRFINTIAHAGRHANDTVAPVIVLRVRSYMGDDAQHPPMNKTDASFYHGGTLSDEVAALVALSLGVRMKAGPTTREFVGEDPLGRPIAFYGYASPVLPIGDVSLKLPRCRDGRSLEHLRWIAGIDASPKDQMALVRAARLYQQALWVAEADPALAWLLLVSAIETAADRWDQSRASSTDRLRDAMPELVSLVEERCPAILEEVSCKLADLIGATRKFVAFVLNFLPPPPDMRPPTGFQIPWESEQLRPMLKRIYKYRSEALHTGLPFPAPMCQSPRKLDATLPGVNERPLGLATSTMGGVWLQQDTPMMLHVFEHIVRGVLQAWWQSRPSTTSDGAWKCGGG